jgi:hypothetical protein
MVCIYFSVEDSMQERVNNAPTTFSVVVPKSPAAKRPTAARRRATAHAVKALQNLVDRFAPRDIEDFAARIEGVLESPAAPTRQAALALALAGGRTYAKSEQIALEAETLVRSFRLRETLLDGALTAPRVAEVLGTSRQTPHDRVRNGSLLAVLDKGVLRFPAWQFDPEGPDRVIPGFPRVLRALDPDMSPLAKANWFVRPNPYLEGRSPLEALKAGDVERVVDVAQSMGTT